MAGNHLKGGKRDIVIAKKPIANNPAYPPSGAKTKLQKQSDAEVKTVNLLPGTLNIGVRVKQTENVEQFSIVDKHGHQLVLTPAPPQENPPNNPVALDLGLALGVAADEKWVTYTANYDPTTFDKKFDTELVLNPFECHDNGFRVFIIAITYDTMTFSGDHYVYGVSILPGKDSRGWPIDLAAAQPSKKTAGKLKKPAKKPAKKTPKKTAKRTPKRRSRR